MSGESRTLRRRLRAMDRSAFRQRNIEILIMRISVTIILAGIVFALQGCATLPGVSRSLPSRIGPYREITLQRGIYIAAHKIDLTPPIMTKGKFLAEDGQHGNKGDTVCELVVALLEEDVQQRSADRAAARVAFMKAEGIASFNHSIVGCRLERARLELESKQEDEDKNREMRDWGRITEETENIPVQRIELDLARRRLKALERLDERGLGARSEQLIERKNVLLAELTASSTQRLLPWLNEHIDQKQFFPAFQAREAASQALSLAMTEFVTGEKNGKASVEAARANLVETDERVTWLESQIASAVMRAGTPGICLRGKPANGMMSDRITEGDRVYPGMTILSIQDSDDFVVEMQVAERDFARLASGAALRFTPDAFPERVIPGRINEITLMAQEADPQNPMGERFFEVRAMLDAPVPGLPTGGAGTVEIMTSSALPGSTASAALFIGREALAFRDNRWEALAGFQELPQDLEYLGKNYLEAAFRPSGSLIPAAAPPRIVALEKHPGVRAVSLPGEVRPRRRALIAPPFSGRLAMVLEDGAKVTKGDVIAIMETTDIDKESADLAIQIKTRGEQLDLLKSKNLVEIERARRKAQIAEGSLEVARLEHSMLLTRRDEDEIINLEKNRELIKSRLHVLEEQYVLENDLFKRGLRSDLELMSTRLEIAKQKRDAAVNKSKLDLATDGPLPHDVHLSELAVKQAESDLTQARLEAAMASFSSGVEEKALAVDLDALNLKRSIKEKRKVEAPIHSPRDGILMQPEVWKMGRLSKVKSGDKLSYGVPFMHVADAEDLEIHLEVSEMDGKFFTPGRPVEITVKSAAGRVFPGFVDRSGLIIDTDNRDRQDGFIEVFVGLGSPGARVGLPDPAFRPGGTCEIKLVAYDIAEALQVPFNAFRPSVSGPVVVDEQGREHSFSPLFTDGLNGCFVASGIDEGLRVRLFEPEKDFR
ncbi:MAG: efflux RND transporter periplasmic adaptor subunit [Candidatus Riflebacteria bacterium]|nr:efflux RND transporter periplasmic adaptor subunit [Candidatus Riflebacteria bacterium]